MHVVPIGEIAQINPTLPSELAKKDGMDVTFLPMAAVSENGYLNFQEARQLGEVRKGYKYFEEKDVLVAKITPCMENGKAIYLESLNYPVGFGSTEFHVLRPNKGTDGKYLFYMIWNDLFRSIAEKNMTGTAGQKRVPTDFIGQYKVPFPPLEDQRRIAAILDKADGIRRKRQEAIKLKDELLRSVFLEMFGDPVTNPKGWPECKLFEVAEILSGVAKGKQYNGKPTTFVPYMRVANVQDGFIDFADVKEIEVLNTEIEKYKIELGDILLTEGGDPDKLGRGAVWYDEIPMCIAQNHIFRVRPMRNILLPEYLSALIGSKRGKRYFLNAAKQTTGIATINKTQLSNFPALVPSLDLQSEFVSTIASVKKLTKTMHQHNREGEGAFNSLVHCAFRGEL